MIEICFYFTVVGRFLMDPDSGKKSDPDSEKRTRIRNTGEAWRIFKIISAPPAPQHWSMHKIFGITLFNFVQATGISERSGP